jgi:TetR/AcrR family transcriptional regulator, tetracycline repressor protein
VTVSGTDATSTLPSSPGPDAQEAGRRPARRPQRASTTLTEQQVVDAALQIAREEGIDALTMRRLSRELGVSPMAAYYYIKSKEELLDLMAAKALADIRVPSGTDLPWHVRLRMLIDRVDSQLRHYRGVRDVLLERMRSTQAHVMRGMMELLDEAGFDDASIVMAYAMIHTYLFGRYRVSMPSRTGSAAGLTSDDIISRIEPAVGELHGRDYYEFGVDTIIAGLRAKLAAQQARPTDAGGVD